MAGEQLGPNPGDSDAEITVEGEGGGGGGNGETTTIPVYEVDVNPDRIYGRRDGTTPVMNVNEDAGSPEIDR